jgi:N6-adenosine-specific RNA methylase IME4
MPEISQDTHIMPDLLEKVKPETLRLEELAEQINTEHMACVTSAGDAVAHAIEVGRLLCEAKVEIKKKHGPSGRWTPWVENNCPFSTRQASCYIRAFVNRMAIGAKNGSPASDFCIHGLKGIDKSLRQSEAQATIDVPSEPLVRTGIFGSLQDIIDRGECFATIYADPPWRYGNQATRASTDNHYQTMSVQDICAEPVPQIVEENAHLHLWTTNAFLREAFDVIDAWGFTYKSCFVWVKPQMGIGNYWRVSHEFLLFGVRGRCPFRARDQMSWGQFDRGQHSAKPDEVRQMIEQVSPGPYLEMYGREAPILSSWAVYGNQVERRLA